MYIESNSMDNIWIKCLHRLCRADIQGSRDGETTEVIGATIKLTDPYNNIVNNDYRKFSKRYANAELLWYLSGDNSIDLIKHYAPQYGKFAEDGIAHGAYGHRWKRQIGFVKENAKLENGFIDQFAAVYHILSATPDSRQAVMTMWDSGDLIHAWNGNKKDIPCTIAIQFFVRRKELHMVVSMRSNDVWLGLPYDVYCFTMLQILLAELLGVSVGTYTHNDGSLHLYDRNAFHAFRIIETNSHDDGRAVYNDGSKSSQALKYLGTKCEYTYDKFESDLMQVLDIEERVNRKGWSLEQCEDKRNIRQMNRIFKYILKGIGIE